MNPTEKPIADNIRSYNAIAEKWERNRRERGLDPCIEALAEMIPPCGNILDIGCGTGYPIDTYLSEKGFPVTGIDPSEEMIRIASRQGLKKAEFRQCGLFEYEAAAPFDAVVAFDSLFHIPPDCQEEICPKVAGMLKPGGLFLFTHGRVTGSVAGTMFGESFSYHALDEDRLLQCLHENGLTPIWFFRDYEAPVTGKRDLLVLARKSDARSETEEG